MTTADIIQLFASRPNQAKHSPSAFWFPLNAPLPLIPAMNPQPSRPKTSGCAKSAMTLGGRPMR